LAFLMVLLSLVTILGNILVILAFIMDRNLRHRSNYFFLNLAVSDFAVGVFCMPLYIPYSLTGKWHLGRGICKLWLVMDYLLCTASVFNIVLISYDRFLSVTKAVSYRAQQGTTSSPAIQMVGIWVFAFLLYCPAILFWEHVAGHSVVAADQCYAEFFDNWHFLLCASTLEFFVPLLLVTYFNMHIFHNIQRRQRRGSVQDCEPPRSSSLSWRFCGLPRPGASSPPSEAEDSVSSSMRPKKESLVTDCSSPSRDYSTASENGLPVSFCAKTRSKLQRDKKITKSLVIIVCVFAVCWAPYSLLMIIRGACQGKCIHNSLYEATFWLLWVNSSLNPFLYPLCHVKF
ncbi:HRH3 protein, partial [Machaerirhynchus nigripectus]|nr:HRH3 protein [Machaerirhynchus nigripectus]